MNWKKIILILIAPLVFAAFPAKVFAEKINNFSDTITINKDGTISVSEKIDYDFEGVYHHGIFRTIPSIKTNSSGKRFRLNFADISVFDDKRSAYHHEESYENDQLKIKIGDPNHTITGLHTYIIIYTVSGALTYFSDHDELYWNTTGTNWQVAINKADAQLILPKNLPASDIKLACYTGSSTSTASNCKSSYQAGKAIFQSDNNLNPSEGLTIVFGFPKNTVAVLEPKEVINFSDTLIGKFVYTILGIVVLLIIIFWYFIYPLKIIWKWYRYGRDPKTSVGVADSWYDPPKTKDLRKLTPGETGTLIDEKADMQDISATIVDLARRGYIKIVEKEKDDFYLEKTKNTKGDKDLQPFEKKLFSGIFDGEKSIRIKDADLIEAVNDTKDALYQSMVKEGFFPENPDTIRRFYKIIAGIALATLNFPLAFIAFIFGTNMPRKTLLGAESANIAKSLKNFLTSQERQLEFQARNQMFFERLLPYAVAFGVEKIWADRFKDIDMKPPVWYQGYGNNTFTSFYLVSALNSSFNSFTSAATPTSSSAGFSSGFSGGFSGGGGGGGGGGSW